MFRSEAEALLVEAGLESFVDTLVASAARLVAITSHPAGEHPQPVGDPCPNCRRATPTIVPESGSAFVDVAVGATHVLAVGTDGSLWAWGGNDFRQLGDATTRPRREPEPVKGIGAGVVSVAAGRAHSLAVDADGAVWAWGWNSHGQLGLGDKEDRAVPERVALPAPARLVAAGALHSFAVLTDGTVMAWGGGYLNYGLLGDGGKTTRTTPVAVVGLGGVIEVIAGNESAFARLEDGSIWAWGHDGDHQLGTGSGSSWAEPVPVAVDALPSAPSSLALGWSHALAVIDGRVWTWGRNFNGQLGAATDSEARAVPEAVDLPRPAIGVAACAASSIALLDDGSVWAWGDNNAGQLGDGTLSSRTVPAPAASMPVLASVVGGDQIVVGLTPAGDIVHWGGPDPCGGKTATRAASIGSTKLGGRPDLAAGQPWPTFDGEPQMFVAQVNLADLPAEVRHDLLPESGLLSFFFATAYRSGFDPDDRGAWAVIFNHGDEKLKRKRFPPALDHFWRFPETPCTVGTHYTIAPPHSATIEQTALNEQQLHAFVEAHERYDDVLGAAPRHQVLGHPDPVQGDMQLECQLVTNGINCGGPDGYQSERAHELRSGATSWRLLLQVDSDDAAGIEWGDGGKLYYWITTDDLRAGRFDRVWCIEQEH